MKTTMDRAGRLVVPKEVREEARLEAGEPLEITVRDGRVEIDVQGRPVKVVAKGKLAVVVPREKGETLTTEDVRQAQEKLRAAR